MTYELAKELKEAGFPQKAGAVLLSEHGAGWTTNDPETGAYAPTLSELIEACGAKFWCLLKSHAVLTSERKARPWQAEGYVFGSTLKVFGSTPEEAVARLWLALNHPNT